MIGLRAAFRRVPGFAALRGIALRAVLRADEIVPFGTGLDFDPRTWVLKETEYGFRIWVALGERSISREIMLDRYEREETSFVRATVTQGDRTIDVGANIGFYTALLATIVGPGGHVIACEPLAAVADALERTVAENGFGDRVSVQRVALDAAHGTAALRYTPVTINAGAAYFAPDADPPPGNRDTVVPTRTLDEIAGDAPCSFVKLDAEGAEPRIVAGGTRLLSRQRPVVLAELNPMLLLRVGGVTATAFIAQMAAHGYRARLLTSPDTPLERYDGAESCNAVFVPPASSHGT